MASCATGASAASAATAGAARRSSEPQCARPGPSSSLTRRPNALDSAARLCRGSGGRRASSTSLFSAFLQRPLDSPETRRNSPGHHRPLHVSRQAGAARAVAEPSIGRTEAAAGFSREAFEALILDLQERICNESAARDGSGKQFVYDRWERPSPAAPPAGAPAASSPGYGITRVLEGGDVLEKAAANVSVINGKLSKARAEAMSARQGRSVLTGAPYFAAALSLVFHPRHPMVPTFRADIRFFEVDGVPGWFGGGVDLTPVYLFPEDATEFHGYYKDLCERHSPGMFQPMKEACDAYFYLPGRKEHRGIGGIFFDDLTALPHEASEGPNGPLANGHEMLDATYDFVKGVGEGWMESYWPIVDRRRKLPYGDRERDWQVLRRGRYLEFNLLYDRGVRFGMDGGGRVSSIMVSAPPLISWKYDEEPDPKSFEAELVEVLKAPRNWV